MDSSSGGMYSGVIVWIYRKVPLLEVHTWARKSTQSQWSWQLAALPWTQSWYSPVWGHSVWIQLYLWARFLGKFLSSAAWDAPCSLNLCEILWIWPKWMSAYFVDPLIVVKNALDIADQLRKVVLAELLHNVSKFADSKLIDKGNQVLAAIMILAVRAGRALFEEKLADIGLIMETLNWVLQLILLKRVPPARRVLHFPHLRKAALTNLPDYHVLTHLLTSLLATPLLHKSISQLFYISLVVPQQPPQELVAGHAVRLFVKWKLIHVSACQFRVFIEGFLERGEHGGSFVIEQHLPRGIAHRILLTLLGLRM